ncbi:MAG: hypothetical protein AB7N76_30285 [Planctomycetota bacterium]
MVWLHCDNEDILDDVPCPTCGISKAEWTVKVGVTRVFKIGGKKKKKKATSWLELSVQEPDGRPLAEPREFFVDLPTGRRITGRIEAGQARVEELPDGACLVTIDGLRPRPADAPEPAPEGDERYLVADARPDDGSGFECAVNAGHVLRRCHWIELRVEDDFGFPLADEPFRVEFSDGTQAREGRLDGEGQARVDGLLRDGPCVVTFPQRHQDELLLDEPPAPDA